MSRSSILLCLFFGACGETDPGRAEASEATTSAETTATSDPSDDDDGSTEPPQVRADLGVEPPAVCERSCSVRSVCQGIAEPDCLLQCTAEQQSAEAVSPSCGLAQEGLVECVAGLSCDELAGHDAGGESPCREAAQQAAVDCDPSDTADAMVCEDLCASLLDCDLAGEAGCLANCVELRSAASESGQGCAAAQDEHLTCVAGLDCAALDAWVSTGSSSSCATDLDHACSGDES